MKQILLLVLKTITSIAISVFSGHLGFPISPQEKAIIGLLVFLVWTSLELLWTERELLSRSDAGLALWKVENDLDTRLSNIRRSFHDLIRSGYGGEKDLYVDYFSMTVDELASQVKNAAETKTLTIRNYHFRSIESVLAAFHGSDSKVFRELWVLDSDEPLFEAFDREYFTQIAVMARKGHIQSVRTIFLYADAGQLQQEEVRKLFAFYASWTGFDCRLVRKTACDRLMQDENIAGTCVDFGIYGERYVFKTLSYKPDISGVFTRDGMEIQRFTRFFDNVWNSAGATRNPEARRRGMRLEEIVGDAAVQTVGQ